MLLATKTDEGENLLVEAALRKINQQAQKVDYPRVEKIKALVRPDVWNKIKDSDILNTLDFENPLPGSAGSKYYLHLNSLFNLFCNFSGIFVQL